MECGDHPLDTIARAGALDRPKFPHTQPTLSRSKATFGSARLEFCRAQPIEPGPIFGRPPTVSGPILGCRALRPLRRAGPSTRRRSLPRLPEARNGEVVGAALLASLGSGTQPKRPAVAWAAARLEAPPPPRPPKMPPAHCKRSHVPSPDWPKRQLRLCHPPPKWQPDSRSKLPSPVGRGRLSVDRRSGRRERSGPPSPPTSV